MHTNTPHTTRPEDLFLPEEIKPDPHTNQTSAPGVAASRPAARPGHHKLTSSVSTAPHPLQATSSTKTVISAGETRPVVGTWPLHRHQLAWRVVVSAHLCPAALEDLNVPKKLLPQAVVSLSFLPQKTLQFHNTARHSVRALKLAAYFKPGFFTLYRQWRTTKNKKPYVTFKSVSFQEITITEGFMCSSYLTVSHP